MSKFLLIIFLFLAACSSNIPKKNINFLNDMTFDEFKAKLNEYAEINSFPNINN